MLIRELIVALEEEAKKFGDDLRTSVFLDPSNNELLVSFREVGDETNDKTRPIIL
jgi:hypothetical protein